MRPHTICVLTASLLLCAPLCRGAVSPNLDFEQGAALWQRIDGNYWKISTGGHTAPGSLLHVVYPGSGGPETPPREVWNTARLPVKADEPYTLSVFVKGMGAFGGWSQTAAVRFYSADGRLLAQRETPLRSPLHFYDETQASFTPPDGTAYATVGARVHLDKKITAITYLRFDDFTLLPTAAFETLRAQQRDELAASYFAGPAPTPVRYDAPDAGPVTRGELAVGKFYTFSRAPDAMYPDVCPNQWTDGTLLTDDDVATEKGAFERSLYVGWKGPQPVEVTIDLGRPQILESATIHGFVSEEAYLHTLGSVSITTRLSSKDPWQSFAHAKGPPSSNEMSQPYAIELTGQPLSARYVKIMLQLPEKSADSSLFVLDGISLRGQIKNTWKQVPSEGAFHGAFPTAVGHTKEELNGRSGMVVDLFEKLVGKKLAMVLWYQSMEPGRNFAEIQNLRQIASRDFYGHRQLMIGWLPTTPLQPIAHGELDAFLTQYFRDSVAPEVTGGIDAPVWFRPMNEFNAGWVNYGLEPKAFRQAWRRLYNIAEQTGAAEKHIFVWSPNHRSYPDEPWNDMRNYWPGDQYVDWVGVSSYPPGPRYVKDDNRRYPVDNIKEVYENYAAYKPFVIAEGGFDDNIDRVRWVREWFDGLKTKRPKVKAVIWENHNQRVISRSPEALALYRQLVQDPYWLSETWDGTPVPEAQSLKPQTTKDPTNSAKH